MNDFWFFILNGIMVCFILISFIYSYVNRIREYLIVYDFYLDKTIGSGHIVFQSCAKISDKDFKHVYKKIEEHLMNTNYQTDRITITNIIKLPL